jgi:hypothetical protein
MEDSLAETYYEKLRDATNSTQVMVAFYRELFDAPITDDTYKVFARLIKIYGKRLIYFALLDCTDMPTLDLTTTPTGLLSYFAKKRLVEKSRFNELPSLDNLVKEFDARQEKKKPLKIPVFEVDNG